MSNETGWPYEPLDCEGPAKEDVEGRAQACRLPESTLRERRERLRADFAPHILRVEPIEDGCVYWFRRSEETLEKVTQFALFESRCCDFLDFGIGLNAGGDAISLRISGPHGASAFLRE